MPKFTAQQQANRLVVKALTAAGHTPPESHLDGLLQSPTMLELDTAAKLVIYPLWDGTGKEPSLPPPVASLIRRIEQSYHRQLMQAITMMAGAKEAEDLSPLSVEDLLDLSEETTVSTDPRFQAAFAIALKNEQWTHGLRS